MLNSIEMNIENIFHKPPPSFLKYRGLAVKTWTLHTSSTWQPSPPSTSNITMTNKSL